MAKAVLIKNSQTGMTKNGYYGYSWVYLFFGPFVPAVRDEWKIALKHFGILIILSGVTVAAIGDQGSGIAVWWCAIYAASCNKYYMQRMFAQGWVLADTAENNAFALKKLKISPPSPTVEKSTGNIEALQKLAELKASGVLTEQEFDAQKQLLLAR